MAESRMIVEPDKLAWGVVHRAEPTEPWELTATFMKRGDAACFADTINQSWDDEVEGKVIEISHSRPNMPSV